LVTLAEVSFGDVAGEGTIVLESEECGSGRTGERLLKGLAEGMMLAM